jgi:hypothetical protein
VPEPRDPNVSIHDETTADALINEVNRVGSNNPAWLAERQMEVTRKLMVSLEAFRKTSEKAAKSADEWASRLYWATLGLFALTVAIVLLTGVLIFLELSHRG